MAVPPAPDHPGLTSSDANDPSASARFRLGLLGALVLLTVVSMVAFAWLAATRADGAFGIGGEQDDVQAEREKVMAQAHQFMLRLNTYGPDLLDEQGQMPEYREQVKEVITPRFTTSFEESVTAAEQAVAQAGIAREAEVFATGVSDIDSDSATVLVAGSFTSSFPKGKQGRQQGEPTPFRVEVNLVKTEGEWLVDDFTPVTGAPQ